MRPPDYTPTEAVDPARPDPVDRDEGAAFAAFMGSHASLASRVKGG